jgi:hypothetical protein
MTEAFHLVGFGKKEIEANSGGAQWVLPIPVGTFAVTAKVEVFSKESGITNVATSLSPEGPGTIGGETRADSVSIGLNGAAERGVATLQAVVGTNSPAKVFLRCNATFGSAEVSSGRITAVRLVDPNHLHITSANVQ